MRRVFWSRPYWASWRAFFLICLAFVYFVWSISQSVRGQEDFIYLYAKNLEEKVLQRTRELEESMAREVETAKEVTRLKDEFIFTEAHELRTSLTLLELVLAPFLNTFYPAMFAAEKT